MIPMIPLEGTENSKRSNLNQERTVRNFLANFKTISCTVTEPHNVETCFYSHSLKDKRRSPYKDHNFIYYPGLPICSCQMNQCNRLHNQTELLFHPLVYKTNICNYPSCEGFLNCPYKHPQNLQERLLLDATEYFRFDLNTFKSQKCKYVDPLHSNDRHDKTTCLYFHNEKDRRRSILTYKYEHLRCPRSDCNNQYCNLAHNKIEQLYHPNRYKSKFCSSYTKHWIYCDYRQFCSFAHDQWEISIELIHNKSLGIEQFNDKFKTVWCPYTYAHDRSNCVYAHNFQDYRRRPSENNYKPEKCPKWNFDNTELKSLADSGCSEEDKCDKCHGWTELKFHPETLRKRRNAKKDMPPSHEKKTYQAPPTAQKPESGLRALVNKLSDKILESEPRLGKGVPFHNAEKRPAKVPVETNHDQKRTRSQKKADQQEEEENLQRNLNDPKVWAYGPYDPPAPHRRPISVRKEIRYSSWLQELLGGHDILSKLYKIKMSEKEIKTLSGKEIQNISTLSKHEKTLLTQKLSIYKEEQGKLKEVIYSESLRRFFEERMKRKDLLQKIQRRKIRQAQLLREQSTEIIDLSFLEESEKMVLSEIIANYKSSEQYARIQKNIESDIQTSINQPDSHQK